MVRFPRRMHPEQGRALRAAVFSNIDGLFAFQVSAADAEYRAQELGGGVEPQYLLEVVDYQCYARLSVGVERLPVFFMHLDRPPTGDGAVADGLAAESVQRPGRLRQADEHAIRAALRRIEEYKERGRPSRGQEDKPRADHRSPGQQPANKNQQPLPLDQAPAGDASSTIGTPMAAGDQPAKAAGADPSPPSHSDGERRHATDETRRKLEEPPAHA